MEKKRNSGRDKQSMNQGGDPRITNTMKGRIRVESKKERKAKYEGYQHKEHHPGETE